MRATSLAVAAIVLAGIVSLLHDLPGASVLDPGTIGLGLGFVVEVLIVAVWAHRLYGEVSSIAAAAIVVTLLLALRDSGLVVTDMFAASAAAIFFFATLECLTAPTASMAVVAAVAFGVGAWVGSSWIQFTFVVTALFALWLATMTRSIAQRFRRDTILAAAAIATAGGILTFVLVHVLPIGSQAFRPPNEAPTVEASALPSIILLIVARPWGRRRIFPDAALIAAIAAILVAVVPCSGDTPGWTCVASASQARALVLSSVPIASLLAAANWTDERPPWWHWIAFGLLAVAVFQDLAG